MDAFYTPFGQKPEYPYGAGHGRFDPFFPIRPRLLYSFGMDLPVSQR